MFVYTFQLFLTFLCIVSDFVPKMTSVKLLSIDFEVFGRVQGVFFRKYTEREAVKLGLRGWCKNTKSGTVKGVLEGDVNLINEMKHWLETRGSPSSRIDRAEFSEQKEITNYNYDSFKIKH